MDSLPSNYEEEFKNLCRNIRLWREAKGISPAYISEQTGIGILTLAQLEEGSYFGQTISDLAMIGKVLGVTLRQLFDGPGDGSPNRSRKAVAAYRDGGNV